MSIAAAAALDEEKMHKKSFHRRHDSGELDVFEAAGYFSGYNEGLGHHQLQLQGGGGGGTAFPQKFTREDRSQGWRGGRMSLDMPMRNNSLINPSSSAQSHGVVVDKQQITTKDHKKLYKQQPSSPGGKLASFLNSLFNQTASSKKKKSTSSSTKSITSTQSMKDHHHHHHHNHHRHHHEDHQESSSPGGGNGNGSRRKRRSSISHFRISTSTTTDSKSLYSSSSSGFRTPPAAPTPTKSSYKDLRSYSDHKQVLAAATTLSAKTDHNHNNNYHVKSSIASSLHNEILFDDKFNKFSNGGGLFSEKNRKLGNEKSSNKEGIWADRYPSEEKEFRMFTNDEMDDDGAESDSSSDLFELQNYDLGCCYSTGNLPVYETTNMESINNINININLKRGASISNAIML